MLTKILLSFTIVCNFATLFGLWIAYEAAPATLQLKVGHVLTWSGAIASAVLYFCVAWLILKPRANDTKSLPNDARPAPERTQQIFRAPIDHREVKITKLSDQVETFPGGGYPLKLRMQMRNDSAHAVEIQLKEYRPYKITGSAKGFPLEVLQIRFDNAWLPGNGVNRIAVLPQQQFQLWIGINEKLFSKPQVESHRGEIGILVLQANGKDVEVRL